MVNSSSISISGIASESLVKYLILELTFLSTNFYATFNIEEFAFLGDYSVVTSGAGNG